MSTDRIRNALEQASAYLGQHPDDAKATDSEATATLIAGLVVRVTGTDGSEITTDMVASVGGTASAPSPGWLLRAAVASCVATLIAMRAAMLEVSLDRLTVTVDSVSDDRGLLGIAEDVPAGPLSGRVRVEIGAAGVDATRLDEIARWGVAHCPVHDAVERAVPVTTEIVTG